MKDLIQEGRKIQETFKKNVMTEEDSLLSKIGKYIKGTEHIEISIYFSPSKGKSKNWDSKEREDHHFMFVQKTNAARDIVTEITEPIFVRKYGMKKSGTDLGDFRDDSQGRVTFYWVELDNSNKQKFSDSGVKRMVDDCIRELSNSKYTPDITITFDATLSKRNRIVKTIYNKSYTPDM